MMAALNDDSEHILISVVMPCRNEAGYIEECLESILNQQAPFGAFEVIVADGMSDDGTRDVLHRLAATDARLTVIDNPARITPCGMNAGVRAARGRYIAIMGAHSRYAPDYLTRCLEVSERTSADNVGGAVFAAGTGYLERVVAASHHSWFSVGGSHWHDTSREGPAVSVWGGFYRRDVFERIGLFDEELVRNQDDELNLRLVSDGGVIWQSPAIRSWYHPRGSLLALFRQYRQYGYWRVRVIKKHRVLESWRHVVPAGFLVLLATQMLMSAVLQVKSRKDGRWSRPAGVATGFLVDTLAIYAAADLLASTSTGSAAGWDLLPVLPLTFPVYHLGYGVGFIAGLGDALFRRDRLAPWAVKLTR